MARLIDADEAKWKLESQRKVKPKTNVDRFRTMTDKQLAIFFGDVDCCNPNHCKPGMYCGTCWLDWLRSPVDDGDE